jgi:hypothetical protein
MPPKQAAASKKVHTIEILKSDMNEDMIADLKKITADVFDKHSVHKDIATAVKQARHRET